MHAEQSSSIANHGSVPPLPRMRAYESPDVVGVFDRLRQALSERNGYEEFCWFAREYPRCYRFHMEGADFRLKSVHGLMKDIHRELVEEASSPEKDSLFEVGTSDMRTYQLYWDFESYLSEINVALDLLARVVGPAFRQEMPSSFSKLCRKNESHIILDLFKRANRIWVQRLKDYRDCFVHYTPVDTILSVYLVKDGTGWRLRAKLPTNPNVREILGFRYSRRVELLSYAIAVHRHMSAFDKAVAGAVWQLFRKGSFPVRKDNLFFVGRRSR